MQNLLNINNETYTKVYSEKERSNWVGMMKYNFHRKY